MDINLEYWHWMVFGAILILSELVITTFFILWFGVAAIVMGLVVLLIPALSPTWQIFSWTLLSIVMAAFWFKFLKPLSTDRTKAGLSREAIVGEVGQVIVVPNENRRGTLRFPAPVLGNDEWTILTNSEVAAGDRVKVIDVVGNALMVEKL